MTDELAHNPPEIPLSLGSHLIIGALGLEMCFIYVGSVDLNSGPCDCKASALHIEPSL